MSSALSPVFGFLKSPSMIDFPSRMGAVFFTSGCNFRCRYCHNPSLMDPGRGTLAWPRLEQTCRTFADSWVRAAVISGGEPTLAPNLRELIEFLKGLGWAVKLDTNGSSPDRLASCLPLVDYVAMDIKAGPSRYAELTGYSRLDALSESVDLLREGDTPYEFRTTVLDTFHTDEQMDEIGEWIRGADRYALQAFLPQKGLADPVFESLPRTNPRRLAALKERMRAYASEVVVRGG